MLMRKGLVIPSKDLPQREQDLPVLDGIRIISHDVIALANFFLLWLGTRLKGFLVPL